LIAQGLWAGRGKLDETLMAAVNDYSSTDGVNDPAGIYFHFTDKCKPGGWGEVLAEKHSTLRIGRTRLFP
jgi:hypothetical protein